MGIAPKTKLVALVIHVLCKVVIRLKQDLLKIALSLLRFGQLSHQHVVLTLHHLVLLVETTHEALYLV